MKSCFLTFFLFCCLPFICVSQKSFTQLSQLDGRLTLEAPKQLKVIPFNSDAPVAGNFLTCGKYSDSRHNILLTFYCSVDSLSDDDVPGHAELLIKMLQVKYPGLNVEDDGISLNEGKNISYIKYTRPVSDAKISGCLIYGSLDNKLSMLIIEYPSKALKTWSAAVDVMIASLRLIDAPN